jgi:hypothetical protein
MFPHILTENASAEEVLLYLRKWLHEQLEKIIFQSENHSILLSPISLVFVRYKTQLNHKYGKVTGDI